MGPSGQVKNRGQLDRRAYAQHRSTLDTNNRPFLDSVPSLADCCLDLVAENYGEPGQLDKLDRFHHLAHVKPLFDRVRRIRNDGESRLPFEFWLEFALSFGMDLPSRWKTYRGLVVSGDQEELDLIGEYNEEAVRQSIQEPAFAPSFFLATLDLSNDTTFTDADVYKLRNPLSSFLAVLKLDSTAITDVGVTWIARVAADGEAYKHLEVLSLKGLTGVTDDGAARLSTLSNLRMLGAFFRILPLNSGAHSSVYRSSQHAKHFEDRRETEQRCRRRRAFRPLSSSKRWHSKHPHRIPTLRRLPLLLSNSFLPSLPRQSPTFFRDDSLRHYSITFHQTTFSPPLGDDSQSYSSSRFLRR